MVRTTVLDGFFSPISIVKIRGHARFNQPPLSKTQHRLNLPKLSVANEKIEQAEKSHSLGWLITEIKQTAEPGQQE